jgi:hypothetical protein
MNPLSTTSTASRPDVQDSKHNDESIAHTHDDIITPQSEQTYNKDNVEDELNGVVHSLYWDEGLMISREVGNKHRFENNSRHRRISRKATPG